ncbi:sensor histidine kinase [Halanaerobium praevalens]|uniref:histidine kinase n=1 Tax=Halanaerobium praevalens (strain ATCC 33744 / DSM 2228 / GSL) TaxID=572479 RepID=E3DQ15_HALPG|nr:PAS domain-containing sensor histidine kinase [Halanaerobium praevalens]ADO76766.1 PAS/PAC sensor signal transduction histidine kinase [Halanaerobium praevalens DSM 2228]
MQQIKPEFDFLFNNLNKISYILFKPTHFGDVNQKMADFCSCQRSDLRGKPIASILNSQELKTVKKFNQEVFAEGKRKKAKIELEVESEMRMIEVDVIPHHNVNGEVDYLLCLAEDITEELKQEEKLYRATKRYRSIFKNAPLAFVVSDRETNIIDWNDKAEEIFGWKKDEVIGEKFNLIVAADSYSKITDLIVNVFENNESYNVHKNIAKDGSELYCEWNTALIKDRNDKILEIISIAQDISEKIKIQKRIKNQKEKLEYNQLRTIFFANISHELKTPLNLIFSSLQILEYKLASEDHLENKFDKYLSSIKNNGFRLLRLVNNLIDITKIGVNTFCLHKGNFDIIKLVKSIVKSTADYLETKNRKFIFQSNLESQIIACDPFNLERVILNLISNAVKFTEAGDEILLKIEKIENEIVISIKDTGIGIKKENQAIIFEEFRQVDQSFNKKREGSGIGLSLAKSIVEMHGGRIELTSEYGVYSKFSIYLPIEKIAAKNLETDNFSADSLINKVELEFSDINNI